MFRKSSQLPAGYLQLLQINPPDPELVAKKHSFSPNFQAEIAK
jgi:hypothetical protein